MGRTSHQRMERRNDDLQPTFGSRILHQSLQSCIPHRMRLQMSLQMLLQKQLLRFVKNAPQKIMCPFAMCPKHQNSDFAVSKLSTLTGTIVVTEASRPVPKNKSMEVTLTTNSTSTKSTRNTTLTTKDLSSLTTTGTDKSTNGALRLSLVLKKSSFANTQDTTKTQLKLKSINSMLFSENKLR